MGRSVLARKVMDYFLTKGKIMTMAEFNQASDAPVKVRHIRRTWNTYKRLLNALKRRYPEEYATLEGADTTSSSAIKSSGLFGQAEEETSKVKITPKPKDEPEVEEGSEDEDE